jgi:hypothetical protein
MQEHGLSTDHNEVTDLSLQVQELESLEALSGDGIVDSGLGACGVVFTTAGLVLT